MALLSTSRALRYHQIGFLDSVFFVLSPLPLDSILQVNFYQQVDCLCMDLLVLKNFFLDLEFCFAFNFRS